MHRLLNPHFTLATTGLTFITACLTKATIMPWLDNAAIGFVTLAGIGLTYFLTIIEPSQTVSEGREDA